MFAFDASFWRDRRVLVTGHTGFKGAWLVLWLTGLGARVTGLSLPPHTDPSLFALCAEGSCTDRYGDIADPAIVARALADCEPEIVIHMAAQALVRPSYLDPLGTYATNVMGTANVLQAVRSVPSVRAVVVVTSDKVYENDGAGRPFIEDDRLGGHDPYSNSKACAELVTNSFRQCFFVGPRATLRRRAPATSSAAETGRRTASSAISSRLSRPARRSRYAILRRCGRGSTCSIRSRAI